MKLLDLSLLCSKLDLRLLVIAVLVVLKLGDLELQGLDLLDLKSDRDMRLITLLLFGLEGETMLPELLAHRPILLQHNLLILR